MRECVTCGWAKPEKGRRECSACRAYRKRNGRPRPEALIVLHGQRVLERRLERSA